MAVKLTQIGCAKARHDNSALVELTLCSGDRGRTDYSLLAKRVRQEVVLDDPILDARGPGDAIAGRQPDWSSL